MPLKNFDGRRVLSLENRRSSELARLIEIYRGVPFSAPAMREVPVEELGYTLPSLLLPLYDSELGAGIIATLRSILAGSEVNLFRTFLQDVIAVEVGSRVDNPPGSGVIRIQFVASQLVGVIMARYILELEPFTSLPVEQIVDTIAPTLQRYLTGDLPDLPAP